MDAEFLEEARLFAQATGEWRANQQIDARVSAPMRNVLEDLASAGPSPVPALARLERVSRQHVQLQVDRLVELGFVERRTNPAHRRSSLIALSPAGRAWVEDARATEARALSKLQPGISDSAVRDAVRVLAAWRDALTAVHSDQ